MSNETTTKRANNVVFLLRGEAGNEQIVRTFRAGDVVNGKEVKSPKRALTAFLSTVAEDEEHELHEALMDGELSQAAGHPAPIRLRTTTVFS